MKYLILGFLSTLIVECFAQDLRKGEFIYPLEIFSDSVYLAIKTDFNESYGWVYESLAENTLKCVIVEEINDSLKISSFSYDTYSNRNDEPFTIFIKSEESSN